MSLRLIVALSTSLLFAPAALAQNATLEVSEASLNRLVDRLGDFSDTGVSAPMCALVLPGLFERCEFFGYLGCPDLPGGDAGLQPLGMPLARCFKVGGGHALVPSGDPRSWRWWITDARFDLHTDFMTFTATVHSRVGGEVREPVTHTVGAAVGFDPLGDRIVVQIVEPFSVALSVEQGTRTCSLALVDVAALHRFSIPIASRQFELELVRGNKKTLKASAEQVTSRYLPGRVELQIDVKFEEVPP